MGAQREPEYFAQALFCLRRLSSCTVPVTDWLPNKLIPISDYHPLRSIHSWRAARVGG